MEKLLSPWDFPGKNTGVGCYFLLQGIFLTQRLNPCILHWQEDSLLLSHQEDLNSNYQFVNIIFYIVMSVVSTPPLISLWYNTDDGMTCTCSLCWNFSGTLISVHGVWYLLRILEPIPCGYWGLTIFNDAIVKGQKLSKFFPVQPNIPSPLLKF